MDLRGYGASLYVSRDDTKITNSGSAFELRADRIGIRISERVNQYLRLGLGGGIVAANLSGQSVTDGMHLSGNFVGLYLGGAAFKSASGAIGYQLGWSYQSIEDESGGQRVELDWLESELSIRFRWIVSDMVFLFAGSRVRNLDLDQRASGIVNSSSNFEDHGGPQAFAGVILQVDPGGFIDLVVYHSAESDGLSLEFRREY